MHFQISQEKAVGANAGNSTPFTVTDSINNSTVTFIDLLTGGRGPGGFAGQSDYAGAMPIPFDELPDLLDHSSD
jgi:hypothetical protein